jgi:uncharacterized protein YdaU (DUF1376 family)
MGKDPAFLFYANDWLGSTMGMSFEEKGAFMELLLMQFNKGKFTESQAKQILNLCSANVWETVKPKFKTNGKHFWNDRLKLEMKKRKEYAESRRKNLRGKKPHMNTHMKPHMEDENGIGNENITENGNKGGAGGKLTREEQLAIYDQFTNAVLAHDDQFFEQLAAKERIDISEDAVKDHLALLNRYPNMQPLMAAEFRRSLIKHCKDFKFKKDGTKPKDEFLGTFNLTKARKNMADLRELDEQERAKNNSGAEW